MDSNMESFIDVRDDVMATDNQQELEEEGSADKVLLKKFKIPLHPW